MDMVIGKEYQVLTISFDSREGTDLAMKKRQNYLSRMEKPIDSMGWRFYTSDSLNIVKLTQAVGFKFKMMGNDYSHPGALFILSPDGKITRYHYGTFFLPFDIKLSLIEAARGQAMPTINRVLEFCYTYDPSGRRYVLDITKIAGTFILIIALTIFLVLMIRPKRKNVIHKNED
jgi:protein SCO1